jgi:type IX secretion system PorP/SprF family membrane protein
MGIRFLVTILLLGAFNLSAQETDTPRDIRQHNLGNFNSNILNPAFSYARNENPTAIFWGRTQWTDLQYSPETYFINYTQRLGDNSAAGLGGFLHDEGIYETGGFIGNYAYAFDIGRESQITLGVNLIGSIRKLHKFFFTREQYEALPEAERENFTLAAMPGIVFTSGNLTLGVVSENLIDYNLTASDTASEDKIFMAHAGYKIDFRTSGTFFENGSLSAFSYLKNIPDADTQYGGSILLDISHGWMQAGYNNFYGPSVGLGAKINQLRIGGIVELPNAESNQSLGTTFEVFLAWTFGEPTVNSRGFSGPVKKKKPKKKPVKKPVETKEVTPAEDALKELATKTDTLPISQKEKTDHFASIEKIEDVDPGFYLVVNVFSKKSNLESFVAKLKKQGIQPGYFINSGNSWYYVYLQRYNTIEEASAARRSKFGGKYKGDSWILQIKKK